MADYVEELLKRNREASLAWHEVAGYEFQIRTPNQFEALRTVNRYSEGGVGVENVIDAIEYCAKYVNDWRGVRECDLVEGGTDAEVKFDPRLLDAMLSNNIPAGDGIVGVVFDLIAKRQEAADNEKKH